MHPYVFATYFEIESHLIAYEETQASFPELCQSTDNFSFQVSDHWQYSLFYLGPIHSLGTFSTHTGDPSEPTHSFQYQ